MAFARPYPFTGHVTLGYVEIPQDATGQPQQKAEHAVNSAREQLARLRDTGAPVTFPIDTAAVYTFAHMSRFDPVP